MSEPKRTAEAAMSYGVATEDLVIPTLTIAERRAQYVALAQRHVRPGSSTAYLRRRTAIRSLFDLRKVIRDTRFLLVGAWQPGTTCQTYDPRYEYPCVGRTRKPLSGN